MLEKVGHTGTYNMVADNLPGGPAWWMRNLLEGVRPGVLVIPYQLAAQRRRGHAPQPGTAVPALAVTVRFPPVSSVEKGQCCHKGEMFMRPSSNIKRQSK
jgi:hypothetical protein